MSLNTPDPPRARGGWTLDNLLKYFPAVSGAIAVGLFFGFILVGLTPRGTHTDAEPASNVAAAGKSSGGGSVNVNVELGDLYIKPSSINVPAGKAIVVNVTNHGAQPHSLSLEGRQEPLIDPGKSTTLKWDALTKSTQAWCEVPGHKDAGMLLNINVTGGDKAAAAPAAAPAGAPAAGDPGDAKINPTAKPAADWKPFDPTLQPADGKSEHDVTFHVKETVREVAPGVKQLQWTYNGAAPGPILRGEVGDVFKITLVNDGSMPHSIDLHASKVAPNVTMRTIKPGESLVYEFKAKFSGIFTYHCGADPMIYHMGNGMFGSVVVDPPGLDKVDKEIVLVQSELYLGPDGKTGDMKKMMSGQNDAVVFNGYYNQYVYSPIKVNPGDRVRVWLDNISINENSAFHVVGTIFDTVWKEGAYTLKPDSSTKGGSQTLDLQPTQGGFVEFTLDDAGTYTFITHKMMNLSRGAAGLFVVGDGGQGEAH